jgi:hypothetical protein
MRRPARRVPGWSPRAGNARANDMPHEPHVCQDTVCMAATQTDGAPRDIYIHIILPSAR